MKRIFTLLLGLILTVSMIVPAKAGTASKPTLKLSYQKFSSDNSMRTIKVTWSKVKNAKSYQVQRSAKKNFSSLASSYSTSKLSRTYKLKNTKNFNRPYYIRVRAKIKGKYGKWSNTLLVKGKVYKDEEDIAPVIPPVDPVEPPEEDVPELKTPVPCLVKHERTSTKCTIRIEWDSVEGAESYEVQRSVYSDFREHEDTVTKKTKNTYYECTASGSGVVPIYGPAKQTYYLRVRAVAEDGKTSDWSGVVTAKGEWSLE